MSDSQVHGTKRSLTNDIFKDIIPVKIFKSNHLNNCYCFVSESNVDCQWHLGMIYTCSCRVFVTSNAGVRTDHVLTLNGTTCENKNECQVNNGGCEQICTDTANGFTCSCERRENYPDPIWKLSSNGLDCLGKKNKKYLFLYCHSNWLISIW